MARQYILFLKFRDASDEVEKEFDSLRAVGEHLKGLREEDLEYVVLEFDTGETVPDSTYAAVVNYCEFWDGVE